MQQKKHRIAAKKRMNGQRIAAAAISAAANGVFCFIKAQAPQIEETCAFKISVSLFRFAFKCVILNFQHGVKKVAV